MPDIKPEGLIEREIDTLSAEELGRAAVQLARGFTRGDAALAQACVRCGLCAESCHYYLTDPVLESHPAYKLNLVLSVFRRYASRIGRLLPGWFGGRELDRETARTWIDSLFGRCSLCGRCYLNCTMGINIPRLIRAARGTLTSLDLAPRDLQATARLALEKGNNMGIEREDWTETVEWLEEELRMEVDNPQAKLPLDVPGARLFYTVNPREPKFFPLSLVAAGKIFHAAGESWTFSSDCYDVTNYGLFTGDDDLAGTVSDRLFKKAVEVGSQTLVLGECGHGFNAHRWHSAEGLNRPHPIETRSIIEIIADYIREGRIRLDPSRNPKRVTLHDPCNLVRMGGLIEEQRFVLRHAVSDFVEMHPNREQNYCCGGGGGQLSMSRYASRRLASGKIKADQIRATGAEIVVAPCHNCIDQLGGLNKEYRLRIETKTIVELVANAIS